MSKGERISRLVTELVGEDVDPAKIDNRRARALERVTDAIEQRH